ncbi:KilA-N domain-containing protein [Aspergillus clavatus NRRL 1]|uniref:Cell pattern formation-associated protein stuA n=1 Tax=Aspergillus clavatus (strain ATCC 1007 / CBS 513.65 / DSM 816 / NCTC 3887 / NRRL 1 / QM 1276 / 107) TaxID=344612 RepID=A1CB92_ASPCL|nr:APSES transcription factor, putative [Aspergillus clavatus NRRL 1]EAW13010.1 APSES transcription factor, putative [Aspergillus clavatus NRRL 1]
MVRSLPKKHNPFILPDQSPSYEDLLALRRLGKTNLAVKPTQIGTSNATKPENLGPFEYAHLRAKLPEDLKGSEIFPWHTTQHSDTYFLMRRSKDGYVSATGMFKIAFPWAKLEEEKAEREYLKSRDETSEDEIAGNIWISPTLALELAKEYQMYNWVRALLDPTEIPQTPKKQITPPPKFELPAIDALTQLPPPTPHTRRGRSASPSKRVLSPRKPRKTRAAKEASIEEASAASASLQTALEMTASNVDTGSANGTIEPSVEEYVEEEKVVSIAEETTRPRKSGMSKRVQPPILEQPEEEVEEEKVKVDIETIADATDDVRTTQTTISVELPISLPEAPSAEETEQMIAKAKEMVEEVIKVQATEGEQAELSTLKAATKRKTDMLSEDEEDEETKAASALRAKRAKVLEEKLKRERVRNRALVGVTAVFALAASIPYFF